MNPIWSARSLGLAIVAAFIAASVILYVLIHLQYI